MRPEFWRKASEVLGRLPRVSYIFIFALCVLAVSTLRVPLFTISLLIAGGFISLLILSTRIASDPRLRLVVLGSYGIRDLLSLSLYCISSWQLPIFSSIQLGDGFWAFSPDSAYYHLVAVKFVSAWQQGIELPDPIGVDQHLVNAGIYWVLGPHPLYPVVVNIWLVSAAGILVYLIGKQFSEEGAGVIAALLVSFWPSSLVWSSQLLKDPLVWFLILLVIRLMLTVIQPGNIRGRFYVIEGAVQWIVMFMAVLLLSRYRYYMGLAVLLSVLLLLTPMAFFSVARGKALRALELVSVICLVSLAVAFASMLDPLRLFSPRHAEIGHYRLGAQHLKQGEIDKAARELETAIALNAKYAPPYLALAEIKQSQGKLIQAADLYRQYLRLETDLQRREVAGRALAELYPSPGDSSFSRPVVRELPPASAAVGGVRNLWELLARGLSRLDDGVSRVARRVTLRSLIHVRAGFTSAGGNSLVGPEISNSNSPGLFHNMLRLTVTGIFAPFPWQWFQMGGSVGVLRPLYGLEMLLFYFLFPVFLFSAWKSVRRGHVLGVFLILFILIATLPLAFAVANLGTLSRLRFQVLIVMLILTSSENPLMFYKKIWKKIFEFRHSWSSLEE